MYLTCNLCMLCCLMKSGEAMLTTANEDLINDSLKLWRQDFLKHELILKDSDVPKKDNFVHKIQKRSCPGVGFLGFNTYSLLTTVLSVFNAIVNTLNNINNRNNNNNNNNDVNVNANANNGESNSNSMNMVIIVTPPGRKKRSAEFFNNGTCLASNIHDAASAAVSDWFYDVISLVKRNPKCADFAVCESLKKLRTLSVGMLSDYKQKNVENVNEIIDNFYRESNCSKASENKKCIAVSRFEPNSGPLYTYLLR